MNKDNGCWSSEDYRAFYYSWQNGEKVYKQALHYQMKVKNFEKLTNVNYFSFPVASFKNVTEK
jgi:hypothetical protein